MTQRASARQDPPRIANSATRQSRGFGAEGASLDPATLTSLLRERDWQEVVVAYARIKGWLVYWTWRSVHSPAGYPDLCLVRGDRLVFAELKAENGKVSPDQTHWIEALSSVPGVAVHVWRPSDWVAVRDTLL